MGISVYAYLLVAITLVVQVNSSNLGYSETEMDMAFLGTYLSSKYPNFTSEELKLAKVEIVEFPEPILQFTSSSRTITINPPVSEYKIKTIALESQDFLIPEHPKENRLYKGPQSLEVIFRPLTIGHRGEYLIISTSDSTKIFFIHGECLDSGFSLSPVLLEHEKSSYGVREIFIKNPSNAPIDKISVKSGNRSLSIEKTKNSLSPFEYSEIAVVRSYFNTVGEYKTYIELFIGNTLFSLPVHIKVFVPSIELPRKVNFGIVASEKKVLLEPIHARNFAGYNIKIVSVNSLSKHFVVIFSPRNVPAHSNEFQVCQVKFVGKGEGKFLGKLEIATSQRVYTVECIVFVNFGFVYIPSNTFILDPRRITTYSFEILNKFGIDLGLEKFLTDSNEINVNQHGQKFELTANISQSRLIWASISSILGKIYFSLNFVEPKIDLFRKKNNEATKISESVNIGKIGYNSKHVEVFIINNSNQIPVTIFDIKGKNELKPVLTEKNFELLEMSSLEFNVEIIATKDFDEEIQIKTSVGEYFFRLSGEVVNGFSKIRSVYFQEIVPGQTKSQYLYIFNTYPVPITIFSIDSEHKGASFEILATTIQPQKEQAFAKIHLTVPLKQKYNIDWSKSLTYGEVKERHNLHNTCENYQKLFEISVNIDISGLVQAPLYISYKKPALPIRINQLYTKCLVFDTCLYYVSVVNTLEYPVTVQLLASPEGAAEEFQEFECLNLVDDVVDDEFENYKKSFEKNLKRKQCLGMVNEEVPSIKAANFKRPAEKQGVRNFLEKISFFFRYLFKNTTDKELCDKNSAPLDYFTSKKVEIIDKKSTKVLMPIHYTPSTTGSKDLSLIIRNNLTVFEHFMIPVKSIGPKLAILKRHTYMFTGKNYAFYKSSLKKEQTKLLFEISSEEFQSFLISPDSFYSPIFVRSFELHNLGLADVEIEDIIFENSQCESFGFKIVNCHKAFILKANEMVFIQINYKPEFFVYGQGLELEIKSSIGNFKYQVEVKLQDLSIDQYFCLFGEQLMICCTGFFVAALVWQARFSFFRAKKVKGYSSKDYLIVPVCRVFIRQFGEPVFGRIDRKKIFDAGEDGQGGNIKGNLNEVILKSEIRDQSDAQNSDKSGGNDVKIIEYIEKSNKTEENKGDDQENTNKKVEITIRPQENQLNYPQAPIKYSENPNTPKNPQILLQEEHKISDHPQNSSQNIPDSIPSHPPNNLKPPIPSSRKPQKDLASQPLDQSTPYKPRPKPKFRKNLSTLAPDPKIKKQTAIIPEIIANNKLLLTKGKRALSDDPAPKPQETIKDTDSEEDYFIDSYKTHNILFGRVNQYSGSLAELTQDSDPVD